MGHSADITRPVRAALLAAAFAATLALGGCGGIEFQGKVFDYMGVSGDRKEPDVRMAERPPLLLPPNTKALPAAAERRRRGDRAPGLAAKPGSDAEENRRRRRRMRRPRNLRAQEPLNPYIGKPTLFNKWFAKKKEGRAGRRHSRARSIRQAAGRCRGSQAEAANAARAAGHYADRGPVQPGAPDSYKNPSALY